jgi:hypothetical protein
MTIPEITKRVQRRLSLTQDGIAGIQTWTAIARAVGADLSESPAPVPPTPSNEAGGANKWPREADADEFYGHSDGSSKWEAEHLVTFEAPYALYMDGQLIRRIRCHKKVEQSLYKILSAIQAHYKTPEAIKAVGLDQYDGCYNYRNVRGRNGLSMHAYGAAVDFDAAHNPLGAVFGSMPKEVVEIFKSEGWRWGGDYSGRKDFMHFEACR